MKYIEKLQKNKRNRNEREYCKHTNQRDTEMKKASTTDRLKDNKDNSTEKHKQGGETRTEVQRN